MAKINNQEVMQKLIDELQLYPGKDLIPTELAEKILPVFMINEQDVNFSPEGDLRYVRDATLNSCDKSLTVASGKKWKILHGYVTWTTTATVGTRYPQLEIKDADGNVVWWIQMDTITASSTANHNLLTGYETKGGTAPTLTVGLPSDCVLLEGWSLRVHDFDTVDTNDDFVISVVVRESDFTNQFA